ncbi:DUF1289 domain-containing protein [Hyphomicrobium methylovorum]|nr:DUF1289 domain-containing protein [Hyphomicrobium methylovorum]
MRRHSPCIGVCRIDEAVGQCVGCARTRSEITDWIAMSEQQREDVWRMLPARLDKLSVRIRLLGWTRDEIASWAAQTVSDRQGSWVTGVPGAVAEFPCTPDRNVDVEMNGEGVTARASDASFRLRLTDKVRAFAFGDGSIVLGIPRGRAAIPSQSVVTPLGPDIDAIDEQHRDDRLFDFGIGRKTNRFCVRTGDSELVAALEAKAGKHWSEVMMDVGMKILAVGPNRVVESVLARIEVFAPIPMPGGKSPDGAHTHLLPEFLKSGEDIPASLALPDYAAPIAIFYPTASRAA